jgi:2-C-methyl-D-erythritol 2,4-cyclodiphosphate synthase
MAKKKGKQVSISALENIVKQADPNIIDVEWNGLSVAITRTISLEEMMKFADNVHKSCFNVDTGAYMPEVKEFAIRSNIMQRYANFSLPDNMDRQYMIVMTSGAVEMILEHINLVQYHALMDAILGALGAGDIGKHFPDSDMRYKGISSMLLLKHVMGIVRERGYAVMNADVTIVAQKPKLAAYIPQMRENIAQALNIDVSQISVKATTEEHLGFTGEGLGMAAHAVVLLEKRG